MQGGYIAPPGKGCCDMWMTFSASSRQTVDDASERLWHVAVVAEP